MFNEKIEICISSLAIANIYYLLQKVIGKVESLILLREILNFSKILSVGQHEILEAKLHSTTLKLKVSSPETLRTSKSQNYLFIPQNHFSPFLNKIYQSLQFHTSTAFDKDQVIFQLAILKPISQGK
jgi:hypothetical protein